MAHTHKMLCVLSSVMGLFRLSVLFSLVSSVVGSLKDSLYRLILFFLLLRFLRLRFPYIFGMLGFLSYLLLMIFPIFLGLMFSRVLVEPSEFFSGFVPPGTPLRIAPFVCLAERIRYIVRPIVLMIRPFLNIRIGCLGGCALGSMFLGRFLVGLVLLVLFFYEIFVALVHWFIVREILSFSTDH